MKKSLTTLYQLIAQLSKSEKRFFSLYTKRHQIGEKNRYAILYDHIVKKSCRTDKEVLATIKDVSFKRNFAVAKKHLLVNLLEALSDFHRSSHTDEQIKNQFFKASILLDKGFIKEGLPLLEKAKKQAIIHERFHLLSEYFFLKKKIISGRKYYDSSYEELDRLTEEELHYDKIRLNLNQYWLLFSKIYKFHLERGRTRKAADLATFNEWLKDPLLLDEKQALSKSAQLNFLQLSALKAFLQNKAEDAFYFNEQFLNLFDEHIALLKMQPERYLSTLNNYLIDCLQLAKEKSLHEGLEKLRSLVDHEVFKKKKNTALHIFRLSNQLELNWYLSKGNFDKAFAQIQLIKNELQQLEKQLDETTKILFYYLFAYAAFGANKFEVCVDWCNKIINETEELIFEELQGAARMLLLLAQYELGNDSLLFYAIINTRRHHRNRKQLFKLEKTLLTFMNKLINKVERERKEVYLQMQTQFEELINDPKESRPFNNFNYLVWIAGKINKQSFQENFKAMNE